MKAFLFKLKMKQQEISKKLQQHPVIAPLRDLSQRYKETAIQDSAAVSTYFILLAIFPLLMIITEVVSLTSGGDLVKFLNNAQIKSVVPKDVLELIRSFIEGSSTSQSASLISFSAIGLIWSSSRGFGAVIGGLNRAYMAPRSSSFFVRRILGSIVILFLGLSLVAVMFVLAFSELILKLLGQLFERLNLPHILDADVWISKGLPYVIAFVYLILIFTSIYYFSSGRSGRPKHAALAGLFTTTTWLGFSFVYSIYINNYSSYSLVYGPLTAVILLLLYLYFSVQFLLIGAFLHREILRFSGYSIYQKRGTTK